jgi:hypothetical protein
MQKCHAIWHNKAVFFSPGFNACNNAFFLLEDKKSKSNQTGVVTSSGGGDLFEWTDAVVVLLYNNL